MGDSFYLNRISSDWTDSERLSVINELCITFSQHKVIPQRIIGTIETIAKAEKRILELNRVNIQLEINHPGEL